MSSRTPSEIAERTLSEQSAEVQPRSHSQVERIQTPWKEQSLGQAVSWLGGCGDDGEPRLAEASENRLASRSGPMLAAVARRAVTPHMGVVRRHWRSRRVRLNPGATAPPPWSGLAAEQHPNFRKVKCARK